jgi:serine protease AprX
VICRYPEPAVPGALLLVAFSLAAAGAAQKKIDPTIFAAAPEAEPSSFLVVLREQVDLSGAGAISDAAERRRFVFEALRDVADRTQGRPSEMLGQAGVRWRAHYLVNMLEVEANRTLAEELAALPEVSHVAPNRPVALRRPEIQETRDLSASSSVSRLSFSAVGANLERIRAPEVWAQGVTGAGIVVGVADSGFAWEHPALRSHYRGFDGVQVTHAYNWRDAVHDAGAGNPCGSDSPAPCDDGGHGTSTSGIAVGDDGVGNQIGVAPGARLIGCRNMDNGVGTPARYTECFQFLLAPTDPGGGLPRPELGADIINNSWGCPPSEGCTDPNILRAVVEAVRAAGIFVAVAAGNQGSECSTVFDAPAIYDAAYTVGATNSSDVIASFSSRGPVTVDGSNRLKPDLVAPGVAVRTATPPDGYSSAFQGTSASAPHVAGAVALLWSAAPALRGNVPATEEILRLSATPLVAAQDCASLPGAEVPNAVYGFGRLDVAAALVLTGVSVPDRELEPLPERRDSTRVIPPRNP